MNSKERKFNTEIARLCGTNAAVIASRLWEAQADADAVFYIDGYPWVNMVRTAMRKLRKEGIVKVGVYNKSKFDHTYSYAFTGYGCDLMRP